VLARLFLAPKSAEEFALALGAGTIARRLEGRDDFVRMPTSRKRGTRGGGRLKAIVAAVAGLAGVIGGAATGWSFYRANVSPAPCQALADVGWAGWNCSPAKPQIMIHGCSDTRSVEWLSGELLRLNEAGAMQLPFQPFKLVPAPLVDDKIAARGSRATCRGIACGSERPRRKAR
jgi:hypothetical protein